MARYRRRSAPRSRRSYSAPRRRRSYSSSRRRSGGGQTLRLVLQQPGMQQQRAPFGTFQPTALYNPLMALYTGQGAPWPAQGGPGIPGARMVIQPVPAPGGEPDGGGAPPASSSKK